MKKTILLTAVALFVGGMANAQIRIGAGINTGLPMGADATDAELGFGIGAGITAEYMLNDNIGVGLNLSNVSFSNEVETTDPLTGISSSTKSTLSAMPINLMANYYFMPGEDFNFYAGLSAGLNMNTLSVEAETMGLSTSADINGNGLGLCPRIGFNYMFSDNLGLDFNAGFMLNSFTPENAEESVNFSYLPINIGVVYALD